jgi:hypothetical protein
MRLSERSASTHSALARPNIFFCRNLSAKQVACGRAFEMQDSEAGVIAAQYRAPPRESARAVRRHMSC